MVDEINQEAKERGERLRKKYPDIFQEKLKKRETKEFTETVKCQDCGEEYQRTIHFVLGVRLDFSGGRCPICKQKYVEKQAIKAEKERQRLIRVQMLEWFNECGLEGELKTKSFKSFDERKQKAAYKKCLEYADNFTLGKPYGSPSLVLFSEKSWGTGKTHLASSICRHIIGRYNGEDSVRINPVKFITEPDMFGFLRASFNYSYEEREKHLSAELFINSLINVPLLVIDDLGKEEGIDAKFVQRTLFRIIDGRYRYKLPMVLTANLNLDGLAYHLGGGVGNEASWDRLVEMVDNNFIQMEGKSYRRKTND